jgi:hypothetical protein
MSTIHNNTPTHCGKKMISMESLKKQLPIPQKYINNLSLVPM